MTMTRKAHLSTAFVSLALTCAGCGNSAGLSPVEGKVLYKGEPAVGARLYFQRSDADASRGPVPSAEVADDGRFWVTCGELGYGAPPGAYNVLVEWGEGPLRTHRAELAKKAGKGGVRGGKTELKADDRLHGRYLDPSHPKLHAEVKLGSNSLPPFELTD
jgi:hypothetical protein